jgi:hypothetical protein
MMKKPLIKAAFLCLPLAIIITSQTDVFQLFVAESVQHPARLPCANGLRYPTANHYKNLERRFRAIFMKFHPAPPTLSMTYHRRERALQYRFKLYFSLTYRFAKTVSARRFSCLSVLV